MAFRSIRISLAVLAGTMFISSASAAWKIESSKDRMTGTAVKTPSLAAKAADRGIKATLEISCLNGSRLFTIRLSAPMTRGRLSGRLRIDDRPVVPTTALQVYSDPRRIPIVTAPSYDLWGHKRFRAELLPTGSTPLFFDFDLTGINQAAAELPCSKAASAR